MIGNFNFMVTFMSAISGLARYDAMCKAIAECHRVDEVKELRDKARALEVYAQQAQNLEAERKAIQIRIRAERRAGELLREMKERGERQRQAQPVKLKSSGTTLNPAIPPKLSDLGITRDQSSKWQRLASVPAEKFEQAVNGNGPKPTTEGIINANSLCENPPPKTEDPDALWLWGRLRDFERNGILEREASELVTAMSDSQRDDCFRILPTVLAWLGLLGELRDGTSCRST